MIHGKTAVTEILISLMVLVLLPFNAAFAYADQQELEQIRQAIKAKGARWHADKTSVSDLPLEEKKKRLGAREDEDLLAAALSSQETAPIPQVVSAPATLDWRNVGGISYVSPVKSQGSCGSCWAFATTAGLESQVMIASRGMPIDLAEQILVSCSGAGSCSGGSPSTASTYIRDVGLPLESCFPYTATNNLCSNACLNWQDNTYSIKGWHRATSTTITADDVRNAVYAYGPIIATMYVYNDFYSYRGGVYSYTTGSYLGAHAVLIVGYDDAQQAFIGKNSWGSGWGEAGYFMIAYSEVAGASRLGYIAIVYDGYGNNPAPDPNPSPAPSSCFYSLSSSGATFKETGGTGSFTLFAQGTCSLMTVDPVVRVDWIRISSTSQSSSSKTISYIVDQNTSSSRSATIDIAGLSYTVKQLQAKTNSARKK